MIGTLKAKFYWIQSVKIDQLLLRFRSFSKIGPSPGFYAGIFSSYSRWRVRQKIKPCDSSKSDSISECLLKILKFHHHSIELTFADIEMVVGIHKWCNIQKRKVLNMIFSSTRRLIFCIMSLWVKRSRFLLFKCYTCRSTIPSKRGSLYGSMLVTVTVMQTFFHLMESGDLPSPREKFLWSRWERWRREKEKLDDLWRASRHVSSIL